MFPIYLADRSNMDPKDDICYIVAKNGLFVKKKLGVIESVTPVSDVPDLEHEVVAYARMNLPKIPKQIFCSVFCLFRKVYEMYHSECNALLFYNEKKKKFKVGVPYQKVSYTGVAAIKMGSPPNYITVGSIHSHSNFTAFHSGVDVLDEEYTEGLHITIGDIDKDQFSIVASIVSNRKRFKVDPLDFIKGIDENKEAGGNKLKYIISSGYVQDYNPEWLNFITGTTYESVSYINKFKPPFYDVITVKDIKSYGQYFKEKESEKKHDPCDVCPFRKEKEYEIQFEELFL